MTSTTTTIRKSYGNRKLYSFPEDYPLRLVKQKNNITNNAPKKSEDVAKLLKYIDDNIIGKSNAFLGPFGRRKVVFCDYTASGRSLQFIEEYIVREVLPCFGSTHSTINITSLQTSLFRHEARELIKVAINGSDEDAILFTSHGYIGAIKKLIIALDLREPPILFISPSEDHDNLRLWQETGAKIIRIAETKEGYLDLNDLEEQLKFHQNCGRQMIGSFSFCSNVTGIIADDIASTLLLHQYGALAFWDYSVAAPYVTLDMNPNVPGVEENAVYKDAIFFSGHKFIGGVQTAGALCAKKSLFKQVSVQEPDGFLEPCENNKSFELQEEGHCCAVIESIRTGLVMQLKETVTVANIMQRQEKITRQMLQQIRTIPEIILLGNNSSALKRLPVFSFMVKHPRGTFLHHNFVCAVLNDMFGIQARGGCPCSGLYAQDLLGIGQNLADQYESIILEDRRLSSLDLAMEHSTLELLRPGFTRISLPYFINDSELAFVMEAVKMVATEGWKLLPQYIVDVETGDWRHCSNSISKDRKWLGSIRYVDGKMTMNERRISGPGLFPQNYSECLQTARNLFNRARKTANRNPYPDQGVHFNARAEKLRWFMLPCEAQELLTSNSQNVKHGVPFNPVGYLGSKRTESPTDNQSSNCVMKNAYSPLNTRHFSLPAIDDPRLIGSPSPVPYYVSEVAPTTIYHPISFVQAPPNFAVGECVSSAMFSPVPPVPAFQRERCLSLGAPNVSPPPPAPLLSPQTRASLGIAGSNRRRNCSCSSQTDLHSLDSEINTSPTHSLNVMHPGDLGAVSPAPDSDLQAYVNELSKELATSIKSEIREVINKVEDVLESTDNIDMSFAGNERHGSGSEDGRSDSISANEVAEYLGKVSIEMANEVKSEIRDVVSAVDVFITPENQDRHSFSRTSSSGDSDKLGFHCYPKLDTTNRYTPGSSSETVIHLINMSRFSDDEPPIDKPARSKVLAASTVTSVSSQDSGINLSFQDQDTHEFANKQRSSSECCGRKSAQETEKTRYPILQRQDRKDLTARSTSEEEEAKQQYKCKGVPKQIWKPTVEAIQEYEMIRNGDKVMVAVSGGKDSLSLLHTLLQYQNYAQNKGIHFNIGAVGVQDTQDCDLCVLVPHLKSIGINYVIDNGQELQRTGSGSKSKENVWSFSSPYIRHRLYCLAKKFSYNVLAIGQHLDDLSESFLLSVFHTGKLRTMRAHYFIREHNVRVIRPFVYVREKAIRQFVVTHDVPVLVDNSSASTDTSKERQRARQLLTQQEILFPKLFASLKTAIRPLLSFQISDEQVRGGRRRTKSKESEDEEDLETDEEPVLKTD